MSTTSDGDVLDLHRRDPASPVDLDATPEGHALRFDRSAEVVAITIVSPRGVLEHQGKIEMTPPSDVDLEALQLGGALAVA